MGTWALRQIQEAEACEEGQNLSKSAAAAVLSLRDILGVPAPAAGGARTTAAPASASEPSRPALTGGASDAAPATAGDPDEGQTAHFQAPWDDPVAAGTADHPAPDNAGPAGPAAEAGEVIDLEPVAPGAAPDPVTTVLDMIEGLDDHDRARFESHYAPSEWHAAVALGDPMSRCRPR